MHNSTNAWTDYSAVLCCSNFKKVYFFIFLFLYSRSCKRNTVDGKTSAWSTISMSMPTCALKDLATESNTGSHLTIPGYVWRLNAYNWIITNTSVHNWVIWWSLSQSVAVEGYETGEHAPGLRLRGTGAYRAAHHIIKVEGKTDFFFYYLCIISNVLLLAHYFPSFLTGTRQGLAQLWHTVEGKAKR